MDLLLLAAAVIVFGVIFVAMGLSYLDSSLNAVDYTSDYGGMTTGEYYANPLHRFNSKWFHYRPKGSVIVSEKQWAKIENSMAVRIAEAKDAGVSVGRSKMLTELENDIARKQRDRSPYEVLGIKAATPIDEIKKHYEDLLNLYDPENFKHYDDAFVDLATIRSQQILKAWKTISFQNGGAILSRGDI